MPARPPTGTRYGVAVDLRLRWPLAVAEQLSTLITDQDTQACLDALRGLLGAQKKVRTNPAKEGGYNYALITDGMVVLLAAKTLLEFKYGRATQQVKVSGSVGHIHASLDELIEQAAGVGRGVRAVDIVRQYLPEQATGVELPKADELVPVEV